MVFLRFSLGFFICFATFTLARAQDPSTFTAPDFTAQTLETRIEALDVTAELSDEQKDQIRIALQTATDRLVEATRQSERRAQFETAVANAAGLQAELDDDIKEAQAVLAADVEPEVQMIGADALFGLEKELLAKESDLATIEIRLQSLQETLKNLSIRQKAAPQELSEARAALGDLQTRLNAFGDGELETLSQARRTEVRASIWYRRNQIRALDLETGTLPLRQELLSRRRAVADIRAQILRLDVARLSTLTGQKRVNEARVERDAVETTATIAQVGHPVVASYADYNLGLAEQIVKIAAGAPAISQSTASVRGRVIDVENDLSGAISLVEQGRLGREEGAILRRIGNQLQSLPSIRADMGKTQNAFSDATRQRLIAQESLRDLPDGVVDYDGILASARRDNLDLPDFTAGEKNTLNEILETRRNLLQQITAQASGQSTEVRELLTAQKSLFEQTESLQTLLDENLLWVRSVPAIGSEFPQKVGRGVLKLLSPQNINLATTELVRMGRSYFLLVLVVFMSIGVIYRLRPRLKADVNRRAGLVGRVKEDTVWHTPAVIGAGIFNSLPLALMFLLIGVLYNMSERPDRLIQGLANGAFYLSLFALVCGAWVRWDNGNGLFDAHFKVSDGLRQTISSNLRWFVPVMGTFSTVLAITYGMPDKNIAEGLSVFVFVLTSLSLVVFSARILWAKRAELYAADESESLFLRFRTPIALIVIGLPLVMIGLALTGYYESANALNLRMFMTGPIVLFTYVAHGTIRRAIVVAQRQLKYREALGRREIELEARRRKEAAEERGEDIPPPPPIDTETIDVSTMTRQTSKLLQTAILLAFAGLLWMIWSSLVPALSIFDGFEVWTYDVGGENVAVSLWDVFQSLTIIVLTFIAARNLPGFLEIFVLSKLGVDAGTRYAVTTILGYIIVGAGIIIGFDQLGLQWSQLKWIATGLSVGIGFGLQKIIANFVSGLIILFERPIRIGDYVTIGDQSGTVSRIQIRATTLKDLDNLEILIPNEALVSERVTNWTLSSSVTRLTVPVGIAYGSDTDAAREIILNAVKSLSKILSTPQPQVLFMGFGDSSLDFEIRVFLKSFDDRVPMTHAIHTEVNKALEQAGISIPFPQRDLNIISQNIPLEVLSKSSSGKKPKTKPKAS